MGPARPVTPTPARTRLLRHGVLAAPPLMLGAAALRGVDGGLSAGTGLVLAAGNLSLAGRSLDWAAGISLTFLAAVALGGYVLRLTAITALVLVLRDLAWVDAPALAVTLALAHLALLTAEAGVR